MSTAPLNIKTELISSDNEEQKPLLLTEATEMSKMDLEGGVNMYDYNFLLLISKFKLMRNINVSLNNC